MFLWNVQAVIHIRRRLAAVFFDHKNRQQRQTVLRAIAVNVTKHIAAVVRKAR